MHAARRPAHQQAAVVQHQLPRPRKVVEAVHAREVGAARVEPLQHRHLAGRAGLEANVRAHALGTIPGNARLLNDLCALRASLTATQPNLHATLVPLPQ